jgi:hypothetical protein
VARLRSRQQKKRRPRFRGYPLATIAYYGPDAERASKIVLGIFAHDGADANPLQRWHRDDGDIREDRAIGAEVVALIEQHGAKTIITSDGVIGCPHEEGIDYPSGSSCPACPYWAGRNRWTRDRIH